MSEILDDFDILGQDGLESGENGEVIAKFFSTFEAEVAAARLRAEGIPCFLAGTTGQTVMPHLQTVIRLHVPPAAAEQARQILGQEHIAMEKPQNNKLFQGFLTALAILVGLVLAALLSGA